RIRPTLPTALLLALTGLSGGCGGKPQVRYQPGDRTAVPGQADDRAFDTDGAGKPPAGAEVFGGTWEVRAEADAPSPPNVLCQTGRAEFPATRLCGTVNTDLVATVRFKPVSGRN